MITKALQVVNGLPRMVTVLPDVYDQRLKVVSGAPADSTEVTGPVTAGTSLTLPVSGNYTGTELEIDFNGQGPLVVVRDFVYVGSGTKTQVQMTFNLNVGDELHFRKTRNE